MCCCWFDRYCLKKYCERKNRVVFNRERNNSITNYSDSEIYSETDTETDSETDSETDLSDNNIEIIIKPDYDEDIEDEYGRPLALG